MQVGLEFQFEGVSVAPFFISRRTISAPGVCKRKNYEDFNKLPFNHITQLQSASTNQLA
jgi:hypothetical protein